MSKEEFTKALELFAQILFEHIDGERCLTTLTIANHEDRLRILELIENAKSNWNSNQRIHAARRNEQKGESFEDRDKVQLLGALDLPNGGIKNELVTLTVENYRDFKDLLNQKISIPVGVMAMGRNVIFYVAKGAQPELVKTV